MEETHISLQEKLFRHRLTHVYRALLVLAVLAVIGVLVAVAQENRVYTSYETKKEVESFGTSSSTFLDYDSNVLCYSKDGISAYTLEGKQIWNQTYEMQSPIVDVAGEYVVAVDYRGTTTYIMDGDGPCGEIKTNQVVLNATISEKGVVVLTLDDDTTTWLGLYSSTGEELVSIKTTMSNSGYPVATSLSADNTKLAVSYLKAEGTGLGSSIAFYNFGDVGQNMTDKMVSGFDYDDSIIPTLQYMDETSAFALGEDYLLFFTGKQIPSLKAEVALDAEVKSVFYGNHRVALIYYNEEGSDKYYMQVYDMSGNLTFETTFDQEYDEVILTKNYMIVYDEDEVIMWNQNGREKYKGDLGGGIRKIVATKKNTQFLVIREDATEMIRLTE